jgi:hypothetical protein
MMIERVEQLLAEEELSDRVEAAIQKLLNVVEALSADKQSLADEVERLRLQLEQKKKAKTTGSSEGDDQDQKSATDHSSQQRRRKLGKKNRRKSQDRLYTLYSTRPHKDRLAVLGVLQNTDELRFRLGQETLGLLQTEFSIPRKWQPIIAGLGEVEFAATEFKTTAG